MSLIITKMKLIEKDDFYLIKDFFPSDIVAGFTKTTLLGRDVMGDMRKAFVESGIDFGIAFMRQLHSGDVHFIDEQGVYEGDALFTKRSGLILVVKTADCLPLFLYYDKNDIAGVVHLGWRSAKEGILDNLNIDFGHSRAVAGAALRKCCFQVTDEFLEYDNLRPFIKKKEGHLYYDAVAFAKSMLLGKGLKNIRFRDLDMCTFCDSRNLFSYRRDKTKKRMLSFILKK